MFVVADAGGSDRIEHFRVAHGDRIRIADGSNGSGIHTAADALAGTHDSADGAVVELGAGNTILLLAAAELEAGTFDVV